MNNEKMHIVRNMLANHAMTELYDETRKLADKYGINGAQAYLSWQMYLLEQMCEVEEMDSDDFGDKL